MTTISYWLAEIDNAKSREKDWRKLAAKVVEIFEGKKVETIPYNILYANTETLQPAVYNSTPRPVVKRRFDDKDPLGKVCCEVVGRALKYELDDGLGGGTCFDDLLKGAVIEALVPGRGTTWFKYDASFVSRQGPEKEAQEESLEDATGTQEPETYEAVEGEAVVGEEIPYDRFLHGYGKKWADVPWVARLWFMDRKEVTDNFSAELAAKVNFSTSGDADGTDEAPTDQSEKKDPQNPTVPVYEIWCKDDRTVRFVSPNLPDAFLKEVPDPLGLTGFFPCPQPLTFVTKLSTLVPQPLYMFYKVQAEELNRITSRINKIVDALKVRGMYDTTVEGLDKVLQADDNVLISAENVSALQQGQTLEKAIWLFPIKDLVPVLQQLYAQRAQVKQVIYEITGIADIMRGSSQASETLGAQEIKQQWGTLRLKKAQKAVMYYARDCLRIMAEVTCSKFSAETLKRMTGLQYPTGAEKAQAQAIFQQFQATGQQPPQEVMQLLQQPSWDDVKGLIGNDLQRSFRIEIETNSTIDAEATEDKQDISELLNALAQFLNGVAPLIQSGAMPFEVAKGMMLTIVRRFQFGPELEDELDKMQPPAPPQDPNAAINQAELELKKLEIEAAKRKDAADAARAQQDAQFQEASHAARMQELQMKQVASKQAHAMNMQKMAMQAHVTRVNANAAVLKANASSKHPRKEG